MRSLDRFMAWLSGRPAYQRQKPPFLGPLQQEALIAKVIAEHEDADCYIALTQGGWSHGRPEDIAFLKAALQGVKWPKGMTLRRFGRLLSKDELRARGYTASLILSEEYLSILTDKGLEWPPNTAQFIVSALLTRWAGGASLFARRMPGCVMCRFIRTALLPGRVPHA